MIPRVLALAIAALAIAAVVTAASQGRTGTIAGIVEVAGSRPGGAVVYLVPMSDPVPARGGSAVIDQRRLRFVPDVVAVSPGASVVFHNSDPLLHNIFSPDAVEPFNLGTYPEGEFRIHRFESPGGHVILCNIHPEMEAWVYVTSAPDRTVVGDDGTFRLEVPEGRYRIGAWHRRGVAAEWTVDVRGGVETRVNLRLARASAR